LRCGLVLAGANQPRITNDQGDDGMLTGLEIVGSNLRGTELVVLSACDTGLGDIRDGEGVSGLRQAFHLAGADTTIATLWKIQDAETVDLMQRFWTHMVPEKNYDIGFNKADALCYAQRDMIQKLRVDNSDPSDIFWAAFALTGQTKFPERKLIPPAQ
jgi:CHAT domain-containing protein